MSKFSQIKSFLMQLAVVVLLAHSVVPHHHHVDEDNHKNCESHEEHSSTLDPIITFHHNTKNDDSCDACHFDLKDFNHNIAYFFLFESNNVNFYLCSTKLKNHSYYRKSIHSSNYKLSYSLRAPPLC